MITEKELTEMVTEAGSLRVFWRYLRDERTARPALSQRKAYDELDEAFEARYGRRWFPSYEAFKKFKCRKGALIT